MSKVRLPFLFLSFFLLVLPVSGAVLSVDCSGSTPGAFPTINAAIASLPSLSGTTIKVKGTCVERVKIIGAMDVRLEGNPTATLLHDGNLTDFRILFIAESTEVTVKNLTIGAAPGPGVPYTPVHVVGSKATIESCTLQGGTALASGALWVVEGSRVRVLATTIQDSAPGGIRFDSGELSLGGGSSPANIIQRNSAGVRVSAGAHLVIWGNNIIRDNGHGVISSGHVLLCCSPGLVISNNTNTGITVNLSGDLQANSPVTFENNGVAAVRLVSASAILNTGQIFRNNGQAGNSGSAAIMATGNAHLDLYNAEITDSRAHGVLLEDNSSARLFNNVIRNSGGNGVRVISLSSARIFSPNAVTGNATDLFCAPNSFARGDDEGFGKSFCPGFDRSPEPMSH